MPAERTEMRLVCVECGDEDDGGAFGWRAYLTDDDELAVYCPNCAEREFPKERRA